MDLSMRLIEFMLDWNLVGEGIICRNFDLGYYMLGHWVWQSFQVYSFEFGCGHFCYSGEPNSSRDQYDEHYSINMQ